MDPGTKVADVDGKPITYGDLQNDQEVGPKIRQAEVKPSPICTTSAARSSTS